MSVVIVPFRRNPLLIGFVHHVLLIFFYFMLDQIALRFPLSKVVGVVSFSVFGTLLMSGLTVFQLVRFGKRYRIILEEEDGDVAQLNSMPRPSWLLTTGCC